MLSPRRSRRASIREMKIPKGEHNGRLKSGISVLIYVCLIKHSAHHCSVRYPPDIIL